MNQTTVREGFVPGITPHPVSDALIARKYSTAEMLTAAEHRVMEKRRLLTFLNRDATEALIDWHKGVIIL